MTFGKLSALCAPCGTHRPWNTKGEAYSFCSEEERPLLAEIERISKAHRRLVISKADYKLTVESTETKENDWQSLINEAEAKKQKGRKKKSKGGW